MESDMAVNIALAVDPFLLRAGPAPSVCDFGNRACSSARHLHVLQTHTGPTGPSM